MNRVERKYIILGAGPSGLTMANKLMDDGEESFLVLERRETVGGLCGNYIVNGHHLEAGFHALDIKDEAAYTYFSQFTKEEVWKKVPVNIKVDMYGVLDDRIETAEVISHSLIEKMVDDPIDEHLYMLNPGSSSKYYEALRECGRVRGEKEPIELVDWLRWRYGDPIANDYLIKYHEKIYGTKLYGAKTDNIAYWIETKLGVRQNNEIINGNLTPAVLDKPYSLDKARIAVRPKEGTIGGIFALMGNMLGEEGKMCLGTRVKAIDIDNNIVYVELNGVSIELKAEIIINTIPWTDIDLLTEDDELAFELSKWKSELDYVGTEFLISDMKVETDAQMIRIPGHQTDICNIIIPDAYIKDQGYYGGVLLELGNSTGKRRFKRSIYKKYAYPLEYSWNDVTKANIFDKLSSLGIFPLGRWGEWRNIGLSKSIEEALKLSCLF